LLSAFGFEYGCLFLGFGAENLGLPFSFRLFHYRSSLPIGLRLNSVG
jgi:hypothetical protein